MKRRIEGWDCTCPFPFPGRELSVPIVNNYIKTCPCYSPRVRNIVSSQVHRQGYFFSPSLSLGNDKQPQLVCCTCCVFPLGKFLFQHTKPWHHQKHLLQVTVGKAGSVEEALGCWWMSADKNCLWAGEVLCTSHLCTLLSQCCFN